MKSSNFLTSLSGNKIWIGSSEQRGFVSPGDSNHSARHHPDQVVFNSKEGSVRTTIAERNPKPLGAAQHNVYAELPGRAQHTERQQICGTASQRLDRERTSVLSTIYSAIWVTLSIKSLLLSLTEWKSDAFTLRYWYRLTVYVKKKGMNNQIFMLGIDLDIREEHYSNQRKWQIPMYLHNTAATPLRENCNQTVS